MPLKLTILVPLLTTFMLSGSEVHEAKKNHPHSCKDLLLTSDSDLFTHEEFYHPPTLRSPGNYSKDDIYLLGLRGKTYGDTFCKRDNDSENFKILHGWVIKMRNDPVWTTKNGMRLLQLMTPLLIAERHGFIIKKKVARINELIRLMPDHVHYQLGGRENFAQLLRNRAEMLGMQTKKNKSKYSHQLHKTQALLLARKGRSTIEHCRPKHWTYGMTSHEVDRWLTW